MSTCGNARSLAHKMSDVGMDRKNHNVRTINNGSRNKNTTHQATMTTRTHSTHTPQHPTPTPTTTTTLPNDTTTISSTNYPSCIPSLFHPTLPPSPSPHHQTTPPPPSQAPLFLLLLLTLPFSFAVLLLVGFFSVLSVILHCCFYVFCFHVFGLLLFRVCPSGLVFSLHLCHIHYFTVSPSFLLHLFLHLTH